MYSHFHTVLWVGLLAVMSALGCGCTPLGVLNATVPAHASHVFPDQAYGPDPRQQLDVYLPDHPDAAGDVLIFFYGGYWESGQKSDYRFVAEALTSKGFIAVLPDYRLYPQVDWRGFLTDGAAAYQWVETHISAYHGNPHRIFLMGHSAGAHIAAMVALDQTLRAQAGSHIKPCGMIGLAGPYDFLPFTDPRVKQVFSAAKHPIETQPIYYADRSDPRLLLLAGDADTTVNPRNSEQLAARMKKQQGHAELIRYKGVSHIGLLLSLAAPFRFIAPTLQDTARFIHQTACPTPTFLITRPPEEKTPLRR